MHTAKIQAGIDRPPTVAEILLRLQQLQDDGKTSASYRKYFLRLSTLLSASGRNYSERHPSSFRNVVEELPAQSGSISSAKNPVPAACNEGQRSFICKDKNKEINTEKEKILVATNETHIIQIETKAPTATLTSSPTHVSADSSSLPTHPETSRTREKVLCLVENLRRQRFQEPERSQQARSATILMTLQPALSLEDIQEAWLHGSDTYWRKHHDPCGMTLTDLVHHNSHGKRRILAALEHKRRQQEEQSPQTAMQETRSHPDYTQQASVPQAWNGPTMTEQEAQKLAIQVRQDGQTYAYKLQAESAYEHRQWVVKVHFELHTFTIHTPAEWAQELAGIHDIIQLRQKLNSERK